MVNNSSQAPLDIASLEIAGRSPFASSRSNSRIGTSVSSSFQFSSGFLHQAPHAVAVSEGSELSS